MTSLVAIAGPAHGTLAAGVGGRRIGDPFSYFLD
jgi:hypothetical protein